MKKSKFTEEQIAYVLRQVESRTPVMSHQWAEPSNLPLHPITPLDSSS
jgi:hypothetical protein